MLGQRYARGDAIPGRTMASGIRPLVPTYLYYIRRNSIPTGSFERRDAVVLDPSMCGFTGITNILPFETDVLTWVLLVYWLCSLSFIQRSGVLCCLYVAYTRSPIQRPLLSTFSAHQRRIAALYGDRLGSNIPRYCTRSLKLGLEETDLPSRVGFSRWVTLFCGEMQCLS